MGRYTLKPLSVAEGNTMNRLTKTLCATQAATLVGLGVALWAVYGPEGEDEMRRTLFYMNGRQSAMVMSFDKLDEDYKTCTGALDVLLRPNDKRPDWATPKDGADKDAFLLGCKEELLAKYDKGK